jgi:hypothetical protein
MDTMHARKRAAKPVETGRHENEMYVVRHQAPDTHLDLGRAAMHGQQIAIE